ncbi:MAG: hypothetical protein GWP17_03350 [Aquificales bacterium]|nr:hypothetical protein [Aquificales bacterium]
METLKLIGIVFIIFGCVALSMGCNFFVNNGAFEIGVYGDGQSDRTYLNIVLAIGFLLFMSGSLMFLISKNSKAANGNKQK